MTSNIRLSLQTSIILLLVLLIVPLSAVIIILNHIRSTDAVEELSNGLMYSIAAHTVDKSLNYLKPARRGLELSSGLAKAKILRNDRLDEIELYFRELLIQYPEFIMLNYGLENGNFMMVKRMPDGTYSTKWILRQGDQARTRWQHENPEWEAAFRDKQESISEAYDPRKRPWYKKAKAEGQATWTNVYIFYSDRKPGITCACPIYSEETRELVGVVGVDIGIEEISKFIGGLTISKEGKAFIINGNGELLAYPVKTDGDLAKLFQEKTHDGETDVSLRHIRDCTDGALVKSYEALTSAGGTAKMSGHQKIRFAYNGETYIGYYKPFPERSDWPWVVGIIAPENDFMGHIRHNNVITLTISIIALGVALLVGIVLARRITKPLGRLSEEAKYIRELKLDSHERVVSRLTEIMNMAESIENMKTGLRSFEKYVPAELVRLLLQKGMEAKLGVHKQELTVLFSDIVGFTQVSEKLDPEVLIRALGEYLDEMSAIVYQQYGTVDKYIGDAIMAFWGAPGQMKDHALRACRTALLCRERLKILNEKWTGEGLPPLNTRFGINTGEVLVGNIGCETRMDYTVIGDNVNLASRLEGINKVYGTDIIVSGETCQRVADELAVRILDYVAVVGKSESTAIYELICPRDELTPDTEQLIRNYADGLEQYCKRQWKAAHSLFGQALALSPQDRPSRMLYERCEKFLKKPPPDDWQGVYVLRSK